MKKFLPTILFILVSSASGLSQNANPTPTPRPPDDNDVVKISTNLVQVDVTVTDKNGKVVRDIKPEEIEIYQNGKKQEISNFSFILNAREITEGTEQKAKPSKNDVVLPPSPLKQEKVKRTIALVVDDLNLSFLSTNYARDALRKFVDEQMQDGDLVAIIRTGAGIGALQQFTNDKRQLYAAIDKIRYNSAGTGNIGSFAPLQGKSEIEASLPVSPDAQNDAFDQFRASVFATGTLGALNYVVRGMADLPGRKSIMLLSDGFALYTQDSDGNRDSTRVYDAIKVLVDKANRASVVIYTMDARGLVYTGLTAQDNAMGRTAAELRGVESDRNTAITDSQEGLMYLAELTGGKAVINNNDLSGGIRKILDDQSYYLIGYLPDDSTFDPKTRHFNQLVVKVTRPGTRVRYRSGFFGVTDEKRQQNAEIKTANRLENALTSPFAVNDISLRLNSLFGNSSRGGSYLRSLIHVRAGDISFTDAPDGGKKTSFDIFAVVFGDNGNAVEHLSKSYTVTMKKDVYEAFLKTGFVYDFIFPVKKSGAYQLRVAFRDRKSEKVGSAIQFVEIPDLKKNRLTLSSVALENVPLAVWQKRNAEAGRRQEGAEGSSVFGDTAVRQFKRGTVLNYGLSIYNAKSDSGQPPNLASQIRLFRDGKPIFEGKVLPVTSGRQTDSKTLSYTASLNLGTDLTAGDYVMAIFVTNNLAKDKPKTAVQFVQFEIVD